MHVQLENSSHVWMLPHELSPKKLWCCKRRGKILFPEDLRTPKLLNWCTGELITSLDIGSIDSVFSWIWCSMFCIPGEVEGAAATEHLRTHRQKSENCSCRCPIVIEKQTMKCLEKINFLKKTRSIKKYFLEMAIFWCNTLAYSFLWWKLTVICERYFSQLWQ